MGELTRISESLHTWPNTLEQAAAGFAGNGSVFVGEGGMAYCRTCGEPRLFSLEEADHWFPVACRCILNAGKDEREKEEAERHRKESGLVGRNLDAAFGKYEVCDGNRTALHRAQRYVVYFASILEAGQGMYLYGPKDTGKTYTAACIANEVLNGGYTVAFATVDEILTEIRESYSKRTSERDIMRRYTECDLAVLDDIGTEFYRRGATEANNFTQQKLFEIVNARDVRRKPTIFTSNYTIQQLASERGIMEKTVDRIARLSTRVVKVEGEHHRLNRSDGKIPF